ncbi:MAG: glycosylase [Planctomycetota bacterium]|nr:glycosylase [Planctomycetota bacterium]MDA1249807.1 glycosylase [Planctomycetota bacterium]
MSAIKKKTCLWPIAGLSCLERSFFSSPQIFAFLCVFASLRCPTAHAEDFPPELTNFAASKDNPVFVARGEGHWDVKIRERGWILFDAKAKPDQPAWRMWYTGYDGTREGTKSLGYATSKDGLTWQRNPQPIYSEHWVEDMMVVPHDGMLYMFAEGAGDQSQLLESKDGIQWRRVGALDIRKKNGDRIEPGPYGTPTGYYEAGTWYLFYERHDAGIWLATSKDMRIWRNVQDEPVISPGPEEFDLDLVALNQIFKHKGRYYASYHGSKQGSKLWASNVAVSEDLIHWTKHKGALFPKEENKSSGVFVHDGKQFRLYTMHDQVHVHFPAKD